MTEIEPYNDEALFERRHSFLTQRMAGGTFRSIAERHNKRAIEAVVSAGRSPDEADTVSATTVRKDIDRAKAELINDATREALRGEHRSILLDMRRANYLAMAGGSIDAAKIVMSTLVREAEMFGLDEPKRSVVGVGTDTEFATDLVALIQSVGYEAPADLVFAARGDLLANPETPGNDVRENETGQQTIDAEIAELDTTSPDPRSAAAGVAPSTADADGDHDPGSADADEDHDPGSADAEPEPWSNL